LDRVSASITLDYITQPPTAVSVICTEEFDGVAGDLLASYQGREHQYELRAGRFRRDLGCIDARAFEERGIPAFYYATTDPSRHDEDNDSIAGNLIENAQFVRDLVLSADREFAEKI